MATPVDSPTDDPGRSSPGESDTPALESFEERERLEVIDRVLARSKTGKLTRAVRLRLGLAMHKVRRDLQHCSLDELEQLLQEQTAADAIRRTPVSEAPSSTATTSTTLQTHESQPALPPPSTLEQAPPRFSEEFHDRSNRRLPSILQDPGENRDNDGGEPPTPAQVADMMLLLHSSSPNNEYNSLHQLNPNIYPDHLAANPARTRYNEHRDLAPQGPIYRSTQKWNPQSPGPYPTERRQELQPAPPRQSTKQGRQRSISTSVPELAERNGIIERPMVRPRSYSANKRHAPPMISSNLAQNSHTTPTVLSPYNAGAGGRESSFFSWQFIEEDGTNRNRSTKRGRKPSKPDKTVQPDQRDDNRTNLNRVKAPTGAYEPNRHIAYEPSRRGPPLPSISHTIGHHQHNFAPPPPEERSHFSMPPDYYPGGHPDHNWMPGSHPQSRNSMHLALPHTRERNDIEQSRGERATRQPGITHWMEPNAPYSQENPPPSSWIPHEEHTYHLPPPTSFNGHGNHHYRNASASGSTSSTGRYSPYPMWSNSHSKHHDWAAPPFDAGYDRTPVQKFPQQPIPFADDRLNQQMLAQPPRMPRMPRMQLPPLDEYISSYDPSATDNPNAKFWGPNTFQRTPEKLSYRQRLA